MVADRLDGERIVLRRARADDAPAVSGIIHAPGVVERWTPQPMAGIVADLATDDGSFVIYLTELDGEVVGMIQFGQEAEAQYRHASIDIAVLPAHHRRGIATDAIRTLVRHLVDDLGHHRVVIDPAADNLAAIACYTSLGFRPVGVMRAYERGIDGSFHDGLLMDLLVGELR